VARNRKSSLSRARGRRVALIVLGATGLAAGACGRSNVLYTDDAFGSGQFARGGTGGALHTGGTGGTGGSGAIGVGGSVGGGGGTVSTGGSFAMGGSQSLGGSSGIAGAGGSFVAGAAGQGPFACSAVSATCDVFHEFPLQAGVTWGNGAFTGGITVFGALKREDDATGLHVTGEVATSMPGGFTLWFSRCSDLAAYTGLLMTLSGTSLPPNGYVTLQVLTNSDYPWQSAPEEGKGACTSATRSPTFSDCVPPEVEVKVTGSPLAIDWTAIMGGMPKAWSGTDSPRELVGLQWVFPVDEAQSYLVDLRLDDLYFISADAPTDCVTSAASGGMGGMGGMSGMAGGSGMAGISGMAGTAGTAEAGAGNEGGFGGEAGVPATGGAPDAGFGGI